MHPTLALALFGTIGTPELLVVLVILLLIFGASKLPQLGGALGKTIRSFKTEMREGQKEEPGAGPSAAPAEAARYCSKCGAGIQDAEAAFCPKCGKPLA